jgi:hypothetical protein
MTIKISQLANLTVVQANTIVPVVSNITGTLTTVQANVQQLQNYIIANGVSANITALYTNAATQSDLIIGINANVTAANVGMTGYVDAVTANWTANALAQQTTLNTLLVNAATQSDLIIGINANVTSANTGMIGYVNNSVTTANVGMIGYVNNSTTTANVGMIGYVNRGNTIVTAGIVTANVGMKGYVDNQTYSNVQVGSYLPTYNGNIGQTTVNGDLTVFGIVDAGFPSPLSFSNVVVNATNDANSYVQLNIQNINTVGNLVSADVIATAPNGTDTSRFIDMGINGNNWSSSAWTVSGANDGYVYINQGNLTLGTDTAGTTVKIHVGGTLAGNVITTFSNSNVTIGGNLIVSNVYIPTANNSVGTTGQISYDSSYVYVCIANNTWRRANISTW